MPISNAQFDEWLRSDNARVVIAELKHMAPSGSVEQTLYISDAGFSSASTDTPASTPYVDCIGGMSDIVSRIDAYLTVGEIILDNPNGEFDWMIDRFFDGRSVKMWIGDPKWPKADFRPVISGIIDTVMATEHDRISVAIRDAAEQFNKRLMDLLAVPVGITNTEGSYKYSESMPIVLGHPVHMAPVFDSFTGGVWYYKCTHSAADLAWTYTQWTQPGAPKVEVTLYASGQTAGNIPTTTAYASFATKPSGLVSMTFDADTSATYIGYCGAPFVLKTLLMNAAGFNLPSSIVSDASWTAAINESTVVPINYKTGMMARGDDNALQVMTDIAECSGYSLYYSHAGSLCIGRLAEPKVNADYAITADDIRVDGMAQTAWEPRWANTILKGGINYAVMDEDSSAAALSIEVKQRLAKDHWYTATITGSTSTVDKSTKYQPPPIVRGLASQEAVNTEAARLSSLHQISRKRFRVDLVTPIAPVELFQTVNITYPRFGFASGKNAVVVGITENPVAGRSSIEVWL